MEKIKINVERVWFQFLELDDDAATLTHSRRWACYKMTKGTEFKC